MDKRLDAKGIIKRIEENKKIIKGFGVKRLVLFGSYVDGKPRKDSDIDILVEFYRGRGLFNDYIHLLHFLEDLFNKEIDLGEERLLKEGIKEYVLGGKKVEAKI